MIKPNLIARLHRRSPNRSSLPISLDRNGRGLAVLAANMDLFSRKIAGWAMRDLMGRSFSCAPSMLIRQQPPRAELIH
ncbi:hypothetical protein [Bradyrhizobium nanningense]|uniref:hypothetical protein n=1 Tax=Bradyrhizobium nanningense TaxID=1325118 RepID=UPI001008D7BC|nr:hypothetical protein [Bradyrhizobium nanningense]